MKRTDITALFPEATDEQIKKIMDLNGADINAAKNGISELQNKLDAALKDAAKAGGAADTELQKARDQAAQLEKELTGLKLQNHLRELRGAVAKEKGVPAELLTGDTEEACKAQADGILAFAKDRTGYPVVKDGGEVHAGGAPATRDRFADTVSAIL